MYSLKSYDRKVGRMAEKKRCPWFPFYAGDWLSCPRIAQMSAAEEGGYIRILAYLWQDADCSLIDDPVRLRTIARLEYPWEESILAECITKHPDKPGYVTNKRLLNERQMQDTYHAKQRQASLKGVEARKLKLVNSRSTADQPSANGRSTNGQPAKNDRLTSSTSTSTSSSYSCSTSEKKNPLVEPNGSPLSLKASDGDPKPKSDPVPYQQIQEIFNEECPSLKRSRSLGVTVKRNIAARWKERAEYRDLEFWRNAFRLAEASAWLRGENQRGWKATLEFVTRAPKWEKILDHGYIDETPLLSDAGRKTKAAADVWLEREENHDENE